MASSSSSTTTTTTIIPTLNNDDAMLADWKEGSSLDQARELGRVLLEEVGQELSVQEEWGEGEWERVEGLVRDQMTLFRFYRRAKHSSSLSLSLLQTHLLFRLTHQIDLISLSSLSTQYPEAGLFYFLPFEKGVQDRKGRPVAVLNMKEVRRTEDGGLGGLKENVLWTFEVARRYLRDLNARLKDGEDPILAFTVLVDVAGASMSNLELELLPYLLDIGHNHFPGLYSTMLVLNSGWSINGAWSVLKRLLPASTLAKISFTTPKELVDRYFEADRLPTQYGGNFTYSYSPSTNHVLQMYSKAEFSPLSHHPHHPLGSHPPTSHHTPASSRPLSRKSSCETLADVFYGEKTTRSSKGFSMTKLHEAAAASVERDQQAGGGRRKRKSDDEVEVESSRSPSATRRTTNNNPFDSPDRPSIDPPDFNTNPPVSKQYHPSSPRVNSIRDFRLNLPPPSFVFHSSPPRSLNSTPSSSSSPPPSHLPFTSPSKPLRFTSERRPSAEESNPVAARLYAKELASHHASGLSTSSAGSLASTPSGWRSPEGIFGPPVVSASSGLGSSSRHSKDMLQVFALDEEEGEPPSSPSETTSNNSPPPSSSLLRSHASPQQQQVTSVPSSSSTLPHIRLLTQRSSSSSSKPSLLLQSRKRDVLKTLLFLLLLQLQSLKSRFSLLPNTLSFPSLSLSLSLFTSSSSQPKSSSSSSSRQVSKQRSKSDIKAILFAALFLAFRGWGGVLLGEEVGLGMGGWVGEWGGKVVRGLVGIE
ncbi:hypothetical protein BDY24DRAFT_417299 [Mrakia frigida]|uniref:CRAL-TRIO domain-containing protein n=1 Tax=Mrakia frigida TaxID=29902 RepID=UPI003FCBFCC2